MYVGATSKRRLEQWELHAAAGGCVSGAVHGEISDFAEVLWPFLLLNYRLKPWLTLRAEKALAFYLFCF